MFTVYVIRSESNEKIYIGQTTDLQIRLKRHNKELLYDPKGYTALNKGPWKLVYKETFKTRNEVIKRERFLKSHIGRDYVRSVIDVSGI